MSTTHTDHGPLAPPRVEDLGGGLYAYVQPDGSWMINNTGFLVASDGVVCVDACATERRTRAFLGAVGGVTDRPVRTLVNTHSHPDHTTGNALFAGATIVAHESTRAEIAAFDPPPAFAAVWEPFDRGALPQALPFLTFDGPVGVWIDDLRCELRHVGQPAHTTNDSYLWVPERRVLYAGDLVFHGGTPFCLSGSVTGTVAVLTEQVAPLGAEVIVPGHGELCGPEVIDEIVGYLRFVLDVAVRAREAGLAPLEAARETDLGRYAEWLDPERIVGNLHGAYADLDGRTLTPQESFAALGDMVTYNGGRPLTCMA